MPSGHEQTLRPQPRLWCPRSRCTGHERPLFLLRAAVGSTGVHAAFARASAEPFPRSSLEEETTVSFAMTALSGEAAQCQISLLALVVDIAGFHCVCAKVGFDEAAHAIERLTTSLDSWRSGQNLSISVPDAPRNTRRTRQGSRGSPSRLASQPPAWIFQEAAS
jgi:hypothetical protein